MEEVESHDGISFQSIHHWHQHIQEVPDEVLIYSCFTRSENVINALLRLFSFSRLHQRINL